MQMSLRRMIPAPGAPGPLTGRSAADVETPWKPLWSTLLTADNDRESSVGDEKRTSQGRVRRGHVETRLAGDEWDSLVERLYRDHFAELCRSARRFLDTRHASEDAVQESFTRFATLIRRPDPGKELPYLRSMVLNQARSTLRRRQIHDRHQRALAASCDLDHTWNATLTRHEAARVVDCLSMLPARQRDVVHLRHFVGLSERETAAALRISAGSVKTHSSRGLSSLRRHLDDVA